MNSAARQLIACAVPRMKYASAGIWIDEKGGLDEVSVSIIAFRESGIREVRIA